MKLQNFFLTVCFCTISVVLFSAQIRQPEPREWKEDLTDQCIRNDGLRMWELLSRERRSTGDSAGQKYTYTLSFERPQKNAPHGLILEFDNGEVVESVKVNGRTVKLLETKKPYWLGVESGCLLPDLEQYQIQFRTRHLLQLYPNGFGRVKLRPASINEVLKLERNSGDFKRIRIVNSGCKMEKVTLHAEYSDFFGVKTGMEKFEFAIAPGQVGKALLTPDPKRWKATLHLSQNGKKSWSYLEYPRSDRWFPAREEVIPIRRNWKMCEGNPGTTPGKSPSKKWTEAGNVPVIFSGKTGKSHFFWLKTRVDIPANWSGKELFLGFPAVHFKADIFINGTDAGSLFLWNTPAKFSLAGKVKAGESFDLTICLTDYIAALLPGTKIPEAGIYGAPSRTLTAAVGHFPDGGRPGLKAVPVLLAEPKIRTDHVFIKTRISGGKRLDTDFEFRNNLADSQKIRLEYGIFKQGKLLFHFPGENIFLKAGETTKINQVQPWNSPELWTPETPTLYEMRITLKDKDGKILDIRRERFGFREISIDGNHFTLNGNPVRFYGFSQTTPKNMTWPFVPQPQTLYRHHFHDDGYYMGGIGHAYIGDELGIFSKSENLSHNAHHGERFAYQSPITWERLYEEMSHVMRAVCNVPSIAFWDIGNENKFTAPGESEKMGDLFQRLSFLDPTLPITIGGAYPLPSGKSVKVLDTHGFCDISMETFFFLHPEKRPKYQMEQGRFNSIPANEEKNNWEEGRYIGETSDLFQYKKRLLHFGNRPIIFGESMYLHAHSLPGLCGDSIYTPGKSGNYMKLSSLAGRRWMLRLARKADIAAGLGHVARFHGREISPVAAFPDSAKRRFRSGEKMVLPYEISNFTSQTDTVSVVFHLKEDGKTIAKRNIKENLTPFGKQIIPVDFGNFTAERKDRRFDLLISVTGKNGSEYEDWEELAVFHPKNPRVPRNSRFTTRKDS